MPSRTWTRSTLVRMGFIPTTMVTRSSLTSYGSWGIALWASGCGACDERRLLRHHGGQSRVGCAAYVRGGAGRTLRRRFLCDGPPGWAFGVSWWCPRSGGLLPPGVSGCNSTRRRPLPGVCLLTGTKVFRFAPFSPQTSADGRLVLGYVRHERRSLPIQAIIGIAPILLNPLGLLLASALLTPLTFAEVVNPRFGLVEEDILASGFLTSDPLLAAIWAYLSLSFAVGSVPSREDLAGAPAALLLLCAGVILVGLSREGFENGLSAAVYELFALVAGLYALPATVAVVVALVISS